MVCMVYTPRLVSVQGLQRPLSATVQLLESSPASSFPEAAEVLVKQLEQLKAEEKELKRKRKQEKAKLKGKQSSSAYESDSSDSDCEEEEVIQVKGLIITEPVPVLREESLQSDGLTRRVEVCMGNKCKKSGGGALLEEFQKVLGAEGEVVGCKCMGKCRDGPKVKLSNSVANPLCIGSTSAAPPRRSSRATVRAPGATFEETRPDLESLLAAASL